LLCWLYLDPDSAKWQVSGTLPVLRRASARRAYRADAQRAAFRQDGEKRNEN
jgi:hypothetical protein